MGEKLVTLRVWGDFACFTRPEMKVERGSYSVMTPSAARGVLEAVYWEPQMYYEIQEIGVVCRGRWINLRRNEVQAVVSIDNAKSWMTGGRTLVPIHAGGGAPDATQRNTLALSGVEYLVSAVMPDQPCPVASRQPGQVCRPFPEACPGGEVFPSPMPGLPGVCRRF